MSKVFKHTSDRLVLNEVAANTVLRKGEMVLVGGQVKVGDGITTALDCVGIGGIPIVNSGELAKNLQNGSIVCVDIPSTAYDITSVVELGMVSYDESTFEITSTNDARLIQSITDLSTNYSGGTYFELLLVKSDDPAYTYSIRMDVNGPAFIIKQYYKGSLDDNPNISSIPSVYLYKYNIYSSSFSKDPTKTVMYDNFDTEESRESISEADGTLQFIGGQEGSTTYYVIANEELQKISLTLEVDPIKIGVNEVESTNSLLIFTITLEEFNRCSTLPIGSKVLLWEFIDGLYLYEISDILTVKSISDSTINLEGDTNIITETNLCLIYLLRCSIENPTIAEFAHLVRNNITSQDDNAGMIVLELDKHEEGGYYFTKLLFMDLCAHLGEGETKLVKIIDNFGKSFEVYDFTYSIETSGGDVLLYDLTGTKVYWTGDLNVKITTLSAYLQVDNASGVEILYSGRLRKSTLTYTLTAS